MTKGLTKLRNSPKLKANKEQNTNPNSLLLVDRRDHADRHRVRALPHHEPLLRVQHRGRHQLATDRRAVARQHHLRLPVELHLPRDGRRPEVENRFVVREKRFRAPALSSGQCVQFCVESVLLD